MLTTKEKILKLAEELRTLGEAAVYLDKQLQENQEAEMQKEASLPELEPDHVLNFLKFYAGK